MPDIPYMASSIGIVTLFSISCDYAPGYKTDIDTASSSKLGNTSIFKDDVVRRPPIIIKNITRFDITGLSTNHVIIFFI